MQEPKFKKQEQVRITGTEGTHVIWDSGVWSPIDQEYVYSIRIHDAYLVTKKESDLESCKTFKNTVKAIPDQIPAPDAMFSKPLF